MNLDIKWARKNVLGATGEIDGLNGVRWLIADNGKYRMAGVIGFLKNICSKCQMSEKDKLKSEELFCDDKGRLVYAFIGVVIDKSYSDTYGTLSIDYLWSIYLNRIYPIWKRTFQEVILEGFTDINVRSAANTISVAPILVGTKTLFESNVTKDYELFSNILCNGNKTNFSFCSNILDFNMVKQSEFSIITTSQNIITRSTRENIVKPSPVPDEQPSQVIHSENLKEHSQTPETKKKKFHKIDDLLNDIIDSYSDVIIDSEGEFEPRCYSTHIEKIDRNDIPDSIPNVSRNHVYALIIRREKNDGRRQK